MNPPHAVRISEEERRGLHVTLMELMLEVDRICRKHGIGYSLFMGTLLGAVRHSGFIPWDDDLDVAMLRSEFARFRDACRVDLDHSRFFYQDHVSDPFYPWGYARIRRKNTEFVRLGQEHIGMQTGVFVDLFPLDGVPDGWILRSLHSVYCLFLRKTLYSVVGRVSAKTRAARFGYSALNVVSKRWVFKRLAALAMRNRDTSRVRVLTFPAPARMMGYPRTWFSHLEEISFAGHSFLAMHEAADCLELEYGDFMTLPPIERRVNPHAVTRLKWKPDRLE
ncbi:LicD family protein [Acidisoma sp. 7E03]